VKLSVKQISWFLGGVVCGLLMMFLFGVIFVPYIRGLKHEEVLMFNYIFLGALPITMGLISIYWKKNWPFALGLILFFICVWYLTRIQF